MSGAGSHSSVQYLRRQAGGPIDPRSWLLALFAAVTMGALVGGYFLFWSHRGPQAPTEIFQGVTYGCEQLEATEEGRGLVHWVRIDLTAPGVELYVTPLDPSAVEQGWQYRLRRIKGVVDKEHLAVAINATLFTSHSFLGLRMAGDLARAVETVVADHVVSHIWEHTYLLWFDDELTPHLDLSKPPKVADLVRAKWGIGGQGVWLRAGRVWLGSDRNPDSRTAAAIDRQRKLLFLAVGEYISPRLILQKLADLGAKDGMLLDGGNSSSMALGKDAAEVRGGILYSGWQPVATHIGVRAQFLRRANKARK